MGESFSAAGGHRVTIRYYGAARAAAGIEQELIDAGGTSTIGEILATAAQNHGVRLSRVLERCSFLLDEVAVHSVAGQVGEAHTLDVLPPFAGG